MDASKKHQLEGLLKARSDVLRHGRRPRPRRASVAAPVLEIPAPAGHAPPPVAMGRRCTDCGEPIGTLRLRAMPRAERCLACQRSSERAALAT